MDWCAISHLFVTVFLSNFAEYMTIPAIPDVTVVAVCPGEDKCSTAIYMTGIQQAVSGIGSVIMMPLLGNLSDIYGRKQLLALPLALAIIPSVTLAWKRTTTFVYAYYVIRTLSCMVTQSGVLGIAFAYLADNVSVGKRVPAFGILAGVVNAAMVGGTFAASLLSMSMIFQVSAAVSVITAIYMGVFMKDKTCHMYTLEEPILKVTESDNEKIDLVNKLPSPKDVLCLLSSSVTFWLAAVVAFFDSLAGAALQACLLYFLKARFHFQKDQLANVLLIAYSGAAISNLLIMPILGPVIGEDTLLSVGLFAGFINMFLDSIAWAA